MDDMNSINRELKKQQLRRQIVPNPSDPRFGAPVYEEGEEAESSRGQAKKTLRRALVIAAVIAAAAGICAGLVVYWRAYHQYTEYSVSWEVELLNGEGQLRTESSFTGYVDFGDNMIKYTKDGASYIDARGKTIWVQTYEMKSPIVAVCGDYAAIADRQGNRIYICDKNGCQGIATTLLPILKVSVSSNGVAAVILEDARSNYITMFQKDGTSLDITIKSRLSGGGYPLDFCLSPDGTQVICSYMYMNQGKMDCRVVFYNFSEIGKNASPRRLVGGFDEDFSGSMVPRVHFMDDVYSFACSDKGLTFFSSRNLVSPEIIQKVPIESDIRSLFYSNHYVGVILSNEEGENPYRMEIYRPTGELVLKKEFAFHYQHASFDEDQILLWNDEGFKAYNMTGTEKFSGTFDCTVSKVTAGRFSNSYLVISAQKMMEITLQR